MYLYEILCNAYTLFKYVCVIAICYCAFYTGKAIEYEKEMTVTHKRFWFIMLLLICRCLELEDQERKLPDREYISNI